MSKKSNNVLDISGYQGTPLYLEDVLILLEKCNLILKREVIVEKKWGKEFEHEIIHFREVK